LNLAGNAIKFTHEGHVLINIEKLDSDADHARVRVSVEDTGIGIESEKLDCVFEKFTQADGSITRRYGGTGLGLAITKQLVELMQGEITVESLGLSLPAATAWVASPELFREALKRRPRNFHKGQAGSLGILGGASGMTGAALLAGRAALKLGAGRVYLGLLNETPMGVDPVNPELMLRHVDDALGLDLDALVVGPGLGEGERGETVVGAALASDIPCVLDADALNLISGNPDFRKACAHRSAETLVTPHPAEAARLLGSSVAAVQADRVKAARMISENLNAHVVLKGNGSIVAARDGHWFVNTTGNPGMASAGMGDVLAGLLGALLAQRYSGESALVLGTRLFYLASNGITLGYQCDPSIGGCTAGSWYLNYLAADDDDGSLADGTPHMVAINDAFLRHGLACPPQAPPAGAGVMNFGCVATPAPTVKSTVTATAGVRSATITWTPVAGAGKYWVLRTDGVHGCNFGKTRVAEIASTAPLTFTQTDLLDGLTYYYSVVGVGGAAGVGIDSCAGAMSDCAAVTPLAPGTASGPALAIEPKGTPVMETGDGDSFVDNCETARIDLDVVNGGGVGLTGIRITAIQPSAGQTQILTPLPLAVPNLPHGCGAPDAATPASFRFTAGGLAPQSTLTFQVTITANELPAPVTATITVPEAETDWTPGNVTYSFENDTQGWTVTSGTFTRTDTGGGANGLQSFYMASSAADDSACDEVRSPRVILTGSSTLSLSNQFAIEPDSQGFFYDRANVGLIEEATGSRTVIAPDGGRAYNASGGNPDDNACTNLEGGWAGAGPTWMQSSWSPAASRSRRGASSRPRRRAASAG